MVGKVGEKIWYLAPRFISGVNWNWIDWHKHKILLFLVTTWLALLLRPGGELVARKWSAPRTHIPNNGAAVGARESTEMHLTGHKSKKWETISTPTFNWPDTYVDRERLWGHIRFGGAILDSGIWIYTIRWKWPFDKRAQQKQKEEVNIDWLTYP